ncbi:MAG: GTPase (G3E family), partial [Lachnospiraceae bacterium]|nr:GTPase (G3E family) [Lachnospiraceae bacterium]
MIQIDLITGFLGSGKTTFIKRYATYLMERGERLGILENDYGAVNVDMLSLNELRGERCELEMLAGGCDLATHMRRFRTKLISMYMSGYTRVVVEPSGIYDVDEFFDVLHEEPLDQWYEIGNVLTIVDAKLPDEISVKSDYMLASQIACAGRVIFSRVQEASDMELQHTVDHLNRVCEQFHCKRRFGEDILRIDWKDMDASVLEQLSHAGYRSEDHVKLPFDEDNRFEALMYMDRGALPKEELKARATETLSDPRFGQVHRVKGFAKLPDGSYLELNATKDTLNMHPIANGQNIMIVIGENLNE